MQLEKELCTNGEEEKLENELEGKMGGGRKIMESTNNSRDTYEITFEVFEIFLTLPHFASDQDFFQKNRLSVLVSEQGFAACCEVGLAGLKAEH